VELHKGRLTGVCALVAAAAVAAGCGGGDDGGDGGRSVSGTLAREHRKAERAVKEGRLPKEALQMFDSKDQIQPDFTGGPGDQDVVRQDTDGDGKPDRNLRFDLDGNGEIDSGERRITEARLFSAVVRVVRPPDLPSPGSEEPSSS
jgi:hypothetical protein